MLILDRSLDHFQNSFLVARLKVIDEETDFGLVMSTIFQLGEGELPDERMPDLLGGDQCPTPDFRFAMLAKLDQSSDKLRYGAVRKHSKQILDHLGISGDPKLLVDHRQVGLIGVLSPAREQPQAVIARFDGLEDFRDADRSHPILMRDSGALLGPSGPFLPTRPVIPGRLVLRGGQKFPDSALAESFAGISKKTIVIPLPSAASKSFASDPNGEEEGRLAIKLENLLFSKPAEIVDRFLFDDFVQPGAERLIARQCVAEGDFAELIGVPLI
ncbi:hypothetical protein P12x_005193 [Tundrisphaera lichenicola]|uniref:hypothetical protein n=1 Tax=Tundrisphaera lichenicola TaxID=2029860 RepID=UPI003EBD6CD9